MRLACVFLVCISAACGARAPEPATPSATATDPAAPAATGDRAPAPANGANEPAELVWLDDEAAALEAAEASGKPLLIDFSADWCAPCAQLEAVTFADDGVRARLADFVLLRIDVTEQSDADLALQKRYGATSLPAIRVRAADGRELVRIGEFVSPSALLEALAAID